MNLYGQAAAGAKGIVCVSTYIKDPFTVMPRSLPITGSECPSHCPRLKPTPTTTCLDEHRFYRNRPDVTECTGGLPCVASLPLVGKGCTVWQVVSRHVHIPRDGWSISSPIGFPLQWYFRNLHSTTASDCCCSRLGAGAAVVAACSVHSHKLTSPTVRGNGN